MLVASRRLSILHLSSVLAKTIKSNYLYALACFIFCATFNSSGLVQAQTSAIATGQTTERIIVKIKPSLARETEGQFSSAAQPGQPMHIVAGKSGNARIEGFLRRQSAVRLTPMYPQIIQLKKQHGWSDAQVADNIRQHFAARAKRVAHPAATPEISRTYILEFGSLSAQEKASTLQRLKADPEVEFAEPEHTFTTKQIPNDPFLSSSGTWGQPYQDLWGLFAVNAPAAWDTAQGDGVVVAVIDTGVDYNHPDLADNIWTNPNEIAGNFFDDDGNGFIDDFHGWNFFNNTNDPLDDNGHGTHVAGTIAAEGNNGIGAIGVAWHAKIMPLKGFDSSGTGFDFTLAPAIMYAANNGADVINASWDAISNLQVFGNSQTIEEAIQYAASLGVVFVASAGNSSQDAMNFFPANSPEAITVASSDPFGNFSFFSNFGPKIDVIAPGEDILSTQAANTFQGQPVIDGYTRMTGTSMAAAHVSGVVALILSQNPGYSPDIVRTVLRSSATPANPDPRFTAGNLNASAAVALQNVQQATITAIVPGISPVDPFTIQGTAQGPGFASYLLEYGQGAQPFFWVPFFSGFTPVSAGVLGTLDPINLSTGGVYSIRLTVFNTAGVGFTAQSQFTATFLQVTSPAPTTSSILVPTFRAGSVMPIIGTAGGPGIQHFLIQWSSVDSFNGWQTTGITLTNNGVAPVSNGTLATWDTSSITQAGFYQIQLLVDNFNFQLITTEVYLEPDLISSGWPVFVEPGPFAGSGIVPAHNADGTFRMVMASPNDGTIPAASWVFHPDGSFEQTNLVQSGSFHQPAVGNIDGLPGDEAVMPDFNVIRVIHPDTSFDLFSPGPISVDLTISPLVLEDLNNNFQLETVAIGPDLNSNDTAADMFVWLPNGQIAPGFPRQIPAPNELVTFRNQMRLLAGDFNGDGTKQILVQQGLTSNTYTLQLLGTDGTLKTTFNAPVLAGIPFSMAAADLDHNGKLETLVFSTDGAQQMLHVFQPDGTERQGWPVDVSSGQQFESAYIAVGDFNRDGHEEIVLAKQSALFLFNSNGTLFPGAWPLLSSSLIGYGPAVIGDVDGDGFPEIVTSSNDLDTAQIQAIRKDGTLSKSWRLGGANGGVPFIGITPSLGDFDQNGTTDIAVAYQLSGGTTIPGMVTVLDTHVPYNPANNDWPLIFQNERNSAILVRTATSTLAVALTTGANPSAPGATVTFTAALTPGTGSGAVQFLDGGVPLSGAIPLTNGVASFSTSGLALGAHSITARYTGDNKTSAATSPVLIQTVARPSASISLVLTAGANPASIGTALTFTASVAPVSATGSVIFFDGSTAISSSVPLSSGAASFTTSTLGAGSHTITAQYSGDANFSGSTSPALVVNVLKTQTTVAVLLAEDSVKAGAPATLAAAITPGTATGTVIFFDGTVQISNPVAVSSGVARFITTTLASGTHSITARYSGDANFNGSTSNIAKLKVK
jgi:subtilisin family serine protease